MWKINKLKSGFEVRHTNGKRASWVVFENSADAQSQADYLNKNNLEFCSNCGFPQPKSHTCIVVDVCEA